MERSTDRILTTPVGSLARPHALLDVLRDREHGRPVDERALAGLVRDAVGDAVRRQAEVGLDVVTDGEQGKVSFYTYVLERLDGFSTDEGGRTELPASWQAEVDAYPEYYREYLGKYADAITPPRVVACTGPVRYRGHEAVQRDIANLRDALAGLDDGHGAGTVTEAFLPATSPAGFGRDDHYGSEVEYLAAVGEAMREEYRAIVDAGFLLQVDDPWLVEKLSDPDCTPEERTRRAHEHVEVINHALRGIPPEKVRFHTCYGLNHGPREHDLPLRDIVDHMLAVQAGAFSFEAANPRHYHEWRIWEDVKLPDGAVLVPGLIGHAQNYVEHPDFVAEMTVRYAGLVGRENVIAGVDCGFSSRATYTPEVHPTIVWPKLAALVEGARRASRELWN